MAPVRSVLLLSLLALAASGCKRAQASAAQGNELFANACARCHGAEGSGGLPLYDGGPTPRDFRDHDFHVGRTDEQLKQTIKNGKGSGMPPFGTTFDDAQLDALVAKVRSFDPQSK